jgi:hypothetical protein
LFNRQHASLRQLFFCLQLYLRKYPRSHSKRQDTSSHYYFRGYLKYAKNNIYSGARATREEGEGCAQPRIFVRRGMYGKTNITQPVLFVRAPSNDRPFVISICSGVHPAWSGGRVRVRRGKKWCAHIECRNYAAAAKVRTGDLSGRCSITSAPPEYLLSLSS